MRKPPKWTRTGAWFNWMGDLLWVFTPGGELFIAPVPPMRDSHHVRTGRARMNIPGPAATPASPVAITAALHAHGMQGREVAVAVGETPSTVASWCDGTATPTEDQVRRLATLTSLPVDVFCQTPT